MTNTNLRMRKPLPDVIITATVYLTNELRFRLWLGKFLLRCAATVLGCDIRFEKPDMQWRCPNCLSDLSGIMYERPWFEATDGGREPNTSYGPGESWVIGIQSCPECGHQWEAQA
ncbi:MAG TPA: hypothetical protein DEP36_08690 [Gammaproteobacteria bacterium]|nr:hypothetical protein [Gammaproteobacteria bacterium]